MCSGSAKEEGMSAQHWWSSDNLKLFDVGRVVQGFSVGAVLAPRRHGDVWRHRW